MNDKERRASKYLPFDSLKGLKERIEQEDRRKFILDLPILSEDEKLEMNYILFDCYSRNKAITISYLENGKENSYSGVIQKIDVLNKQIIFLPKKKFSLDSIYRVVMK
ncbi:MAG: YolD-like family protein [Roseburia sp.]|nr:YolD-like family protein [Anaeroplasma bactoclasticum]MCM1196389.1 YolD-like family protein [Roseburia sp.]MCM1556155.1 YolD-like family protein [Anaeroplasma bactoclasticum]